MAPHYGTWKFLFINLPFLCEEKHNLFSMGVRCVLITTPEINLPCIILRNAKNTTPKCAHACYFIKSFPLLLFSAINTFYTNQIVHNSVMIDLLVVLLD